MKRRILSLFLLLTVLLSMMGAPAAVAEPTPTPAPITYSAYNFVTLYYGCNSRYVVDLQLRLIELGYLKGEADGDFGNATEKAVKAYQKKSGFTQDGVATPEMQAVLFNSGALNAKGKTSAAFDRSAQPDVDYVSSGATVKPKLTPAPEKTKAPSSYNSSGISYIGNKKTKKFHYPSCYSVGQMKDKNKVSLDSREEAISKGYVPCKKCYP